jgi:carboxylesterase
MTPYDQNPNLHNPHLDGSPIYKPNGKTGVVLLHGFTATPVEVRNLAEYFHQKGLSVAAPTLAGHGTSPQDLYTVHWQDWIATAEESYAQLSAVCDQIFMAGESTGAVVSLYVAAIHPELAGVLAFAPAMRLPLGWMDRFVIQFLYKFIKEKPKMDLEQDTTWQGYRVNPLNGVRQLLALQNATIAKLKDVVQPVVVVMGGRDKTIDPISGDLVYQGISSAIKETHFFPESPHCILLGKDFEKAASLAWQFIQKTTI